MWDAYTPLTRAGLDVTINTSGGASADAIARRGPDDPADPELVDRLLGDGDEARIEAESTTGDQQPGVTAHHVCQGLEEGRRTIVLVRPDTRHRVEHTLRDDPPLCRTNASTDTETRYYTSTATITFGGEEQFRPGEEGDENVWVREHETGDIVLRDTDGTEHARFEQPGAVLSDLEPYPQCGECRIKAPVIPEAYDHGHDDPAQAATIVTVPPGGEGDLDVEGYPTTLDDSGPRGVTPETLDVPDRAVKLYQLLHAEDVEIVTKREAHELVDAHGNGLEASRRTVNSWVNVLRDEGVLEEVGTDEHGATTLEVR